MSQAVKAVVFDFFGVVCVDLAELTGAEFSQRRGINPVNFSRFGGEYRTQLDEGRMSQLEFATQLQKHFKLSVSPEALCQELDALDGRFYSFDPRLHDLIVELKTSIKVALMSNSSRDESNYLRTLGAYDIFDQVYLSATSGKTKTDQSWFADVATDLGLLPAEIMLVDDGSGNVETALAAGWVNSVRYTSVDALRRDLLARHLAVT